MFSCLVAAIFSFSLAIPINADSFPVLDLEEVTANDQRLIDPTDRSWENELTIASFSIRNLATGEHVSEAAASRINAFIAMFEALLGEGWTVKAADFPTGRANGRETNVLAHATLAGIELWRLL